MYYIIALSIVFIHISLYMNDYIIALYMNIYNNNCLFLFGISNE